MSKFAVKNRYGIELVAGRKEGKYLYIPYCEGEESYRKCEKWTKKHDTANTCVIVDLHDISEIKE